MFAFSNQPFDVVVVLEKYSLQSTNLSHWLTAIDDVSLGDCVVCMEYLKEGPSWQVESQAWVVGGLRGWPKEVLTEPKRVE